MRWATVIRWKRPLEDAISCEILTKQIFINQLAIGHFGRAPGGAATGVRRRRKWTPAARARPQVVALGIRLA